MRITLFYILIFSLFAQAVAAAHGPLGRGLAADKDKPVLRIGYEEKPKLSAPPKKPLPDITEYYGETGAALQALNLESGEKLEEALLRPMGGEIKDPVFRRYREYLYREFSKGLSRAQMILIVRDQLPAIIQAFSMNANDLFYAKHFYDLVANNLAKADRSDFSNYNVFFEFDSSGRFQTTDIEPNRLAINTGNGVYFNLRDIAKKETFTVADAVQLWLHEILHIDQSFSLDLRDAWGAKVAQWVRARTTEIQMTPDRKIVALFTPEGDRGKIDSISRFPESDLTTSVKDRFLIFEETPKGAKVLNDIYTGFATFDNSIGKMTDFSKSLPSVIQLPLVTVNKIRKTSKNTLQIEYHQETAIYRENYQNGYQRDNSGIGYSGLQILPGDKFRIEWNAENSAVETSRSYSRPLADGDFEIYRVKDVNEKRYVSLRVKTKELKALLEAESLHLIAKGKGSSQLLSFELKQVRILSKDEVLIHALLPQKTIEISQILFPAPNAEYTYTESTLRPSRPILLQGRAESVVSKLKVQSISVQGRVTDQDQLRMRIELADAKNVKGLTLDLEHEMRANTFRVMNGRMVSDLHGFLGMGRKYYFSGSQLKVSFEGISFVVPEVDLTKYQMGPVMSQRISGHFTNSWKDELPYLQDNQRRRITAVWVHFADGRVEKVPISQLPKESFSFISNEENSRISEAANKRAKAYMDQLDYGTAPAEPVTPQTCEDLF
jgi:hypothetical protein